MPGDPNAWDKWFDGMGLSAAKHGMKVFYCMAWASVLLNSVKLPAAEISRASADYIVGHGGPCSPKPASRSVRRALLTPMGESWATLSLR